METGMVFVFFCFFFFQAEDGIRDRVRSRGLGEVYKRQVLCRSALAARGRMIEQLCALPPIATALDAIIERLSLIHI